MVTLFSHAVWVSTVCIQTLCSTHSIIVLTHLNVLDDKQDCVRYNCKMKSMLVSVVVVFVVVVVAVVVDWGLWTGLWLRSVVDVLFQPITQKRNQPRLPQPATTTTTNQQHNETPQPQLTTATTTNHHNRNQPLQVQQTTTTETNHHNCNKLPQPKPTTRATTNHQHDNEPPQPQLTTTATTNHRIQSLCVIIHKSYRIKQILIAQGIMYIYSMSTSGITSASHRCCIWRLVSVLSPTSLTFRFASSITMMMQSNHIDHVTLLFM